MSKIVTKSKFMQANRCPKMVYLELNKPCEAANTKATSMGDFFGFTARAALGAEITIEGDAPQKMVLNTQNAISYGFNVIAEASFMSSDLFCSCDVFHIIDKEGKIADIYEVKSTTSYSDSQVLDVSFQAYILKSCGWNIRNCYIVTVNSSYTNTDGEIDRNKVFKNNDVTSKVTETIFYLPEKIERAREIINNCDSEPAVELNKHCKEGFDCPFLGYCIKQCDSDVFNIGSLRFSTKVKLYNNNVRTYQDIIDNAEKMKLSESCIAQAKAHLGGIDIIKPEKIRDFIQGFKFPLYFLDFESFQVSMPVWKDTAAYQQIPFQYSLHKMGSSGKLTHMEFIGEAGADPRRKIAVSLCENIKSKGTVLAYNSSFEKARIRELAELFPDLKKNLIQIEKRIEDLMVPFQKRWVYKAAQNGSYSIKAVLPALYPNDPRLDYHKLDIVHNGTEAMTEYCRLNDYPKEDRELTIQALLKYCELDTYALVLVYEFLRSASL